ncbi:MAG: SET domain-containing protein [Verrucomicrobiota bacterium]
MNGPDVVARPSPIAGLGLFALRAFVAGERIAAYVGPVSARPPSDSGGGVFALEISPGRWLDGGGPDNPARLANHSCAPTAELIWDEASGQAWLTASRPLAPGEEITFDYGFSLAESLRHPCRCGAPDCVGRIIAAPRRAALRRHMRFSRPRD